MTYLARRMPAGSLSTPVKLNAITRVDRDFKVDVYSSMSVLWNNLERIHLYFDHYGTAKMTKDELRHRLETEGSVRVYDRDARSNAEWYWQFELHK